MTVRVHDLIKAARTDVFRRAYIKRRNSQTADYEDGWFEITGDVKSFGKIIKQADAVRRNKFTFGTLKLTVNNEDGRYNPHTSDSSQWKGYLNQQRTLFRIEAGFYRRYKNDYGVWRNEQYIGNTLWDEAEWDRDDSCWDAEAAVFTGILSGDIPLSDNNQINFNIKPLTSIFEEYPARNLTGWTSTGLTASQFVTMLRDQTDGAGGFLFRPFFGNTITYWDISTTAQVYADLNTSTAEGVFDSSVWEIIEKLSEAENFIPYVTGDGKFKFVSRSPASTDLNFEFHGAGSFSGEFGQTIRTVPQYGPKLTKYYSRVKVKFEREDTVTSYVVNQGSYTVSPASSAWVLGLRTYETQNLLIPDTATASTIATTIFNDVSALKNEIEITTSFIPHLEIIDRFSITYDPTEFKEESLWDQNYWDDDTTTSNIQALIFDNSKGDAIILEGDEYRFLSIEMDLDSLQNKYVAREV